MRLQHISDALIYKKEYGELRLLCGSGVKDMDSERLDLKLLTLRPEGKTSTHFHLRSETVLHVLKGVICLTGTRTVHLTEGHTVVVEVTERHCIENIGGEDALVMEAQAPPYRADDKFHSVEEFPLPSRALGRFWKIDDKIKVKICGVKNLDSALECLRLGVDAIGIHAIGQHGLSEAFSMTEWLSLVPAELSIFVLTDTRDWHVLQMLLAKTNCDTLQIQGPTDFGLLDRLSRFMRASNRKIVKTVSAQDETQIEELQHLAADLSRFVDAILIDASDYGGTGRLHNWRLTKELKKNIQVPLIIAGGLTPSNCNEAIDRLRPYAIDVESGVEHWFFLSGRRFTAKNFGAVERIVQIAGRKFF
ncbi:MAG TPA: hypothetical protein VGM86_04145 [Thermoanaerobaculia bacterium]|jgi:phosphoribosylanthranilate isomerase